LAGPEQRIEAVLRGNLAIALAAGRASPPSTRVGDVDELQ
jgi:hypothetical protein